jgi:N-glycosylase/DNA lyase
MELPFVLSQEEQHLIEKRLGEFKALGQAGNDVWFSELCFCILTAQSKAQKAIAIQQELQPAGFLYSSLDTIKKILKNHAHRFYNKKSEYIVQARAHALVKDALAGMSESQARLYLAQTVKGIGLKEASHFLRNVGYDDSAIIDRHIIRFLINYGFITAPPKTLTLHRYLELEELLRCFNIPLSKLDLMIWCHMTDTILK